MTALLHAGIPLPRRWPSEEWARVEVYARSHGRCARLAYPESATRLDRRPAAHGGAR